MNAFKKAILATFCSVLLFGSFAYACDCAQKPKCKVMKNDSPCGEKCKCYKGTKACDKNKKMPTGCPQMDGNATKPQNKPAADEGIPDMPPMPPAQPPQPKSSGMN